MIQKTVQDDLLRYHKTLLVWTNKITNSQDLWESTSFKKGEPSKQNSEVAEELAQVKKCLIDIMKEHKNGVSLAQLPQHLKRKLHFDLNL